MGESCLLCKKRRMTIVAKGNNKIILTRTITRRGIYIDYRKLKKATRKDHFPLPSIEEMLDKLARHSYYFFLDGYSSYNQIVIALKDQEK